MSPKRSKWLIFCKVKDEGERERERDKASDTSHQGDLHSHESWIPAPDRVGWFAWVG